MGQVVVVDWSTAAAIVGEQWARQGRISLPPDDVLIDDDVALWDAVEALVNGDDGSVLAEASVYNELLHPRDRLGHWIGTRGFKVKFTHAAEPSASTRGKTITVAGPDADTQYEALLTHAHGLTGRVTKGTASSATSRGRKGERHTVPVVFERAKMRAATKADALDRRLQRIEQVAIEAHAGQRDKRGKPYVAHVLAVADSVSREARPVALLHDALEDGRITEHDLRVTLHPDEVEAVKLLTRDPVTHGQPGEYDRYIERLASATGRKGELAREVKRADLQHNLGRIGPAQESLRPRYEKALDTLAVEPRPITQRGTPENRKHKDEAVVMANLEQRYQAAVKSGTAAADMNWYQTAHDQILRLAEKHKVDPYTFAAIVAACSPQMEWRHKYVDGRPVRFPNLDLAVHAIELARDHPAEPAPHLIDRLVTATKKRKKDEKGELGGLGESMLKAVRIYRGEDPERVLNAPKTRSFLNNLAFPDRVTTVTIDEHMGRAILGKGRENYAKSTEGILDERTKDGHVAGSGYVWAAGLIEEFAKDKGLMPHQVQAIIWTSQKEIADEIDAQKRAAKRAAKRAGKA